MKIGNEELKYGVILAPMAGFSDRAMRLVCHKFGCEYSVSEMVSAKAVVYGDRKTFALARLRDDEGPAAVQIFGKEPEIMSEAAARLLSAVDSDSASPRAIDINMGCPVHKIYSNGEGSALMKSPELIYKIVRAVSSSIEIPTTVKLRAGIDEESKNAVECALAAEEGGAALIAVHGRTKAEMYSGKVDTGIIKAVKDAVKIPVIANGDITSAEDAVRMLSETGADGIMIGRGAIGNPFVFAEILTRLEGGEYTPPTLAEGIDAALLQLSAAVEEKGETVAVREARKQIALYLRSFRGAAAIRAEINRAESYTDVKAALLTALAQN